VSINELTARWIAAKHKEREAIEERRHIEYDIQRAMEAEGLGYLPTPCATVSLKEAYEWLEDADRLLQPALEYLLAGDKDNLVKRIPASYAINGTVVNKLLKMAGTPALIVASARKRVGLKLEIRAGTTEKMS
jgi:hypothetical protein